MSGWRWALAALLASALSACALTPSAPVGVGLSEVLSGRISVRIDEIGATATSPGAPGRAVSAAFELSGNPQRGRLDLNSPLGTTVARARWQPGVVVVNSPQGESTHADLDSMSRALLGEALPVAALFDWLRGRPWPGAPVGVPVALPAGAQISALRSANDFAQLGWDVNLSQFAQSWVSLRRAANGPDSPGISVRVKLDTP